MKLSCPLVGLGDFVLEMKSYSDLADRVLADDDLLRKLQPAEPRDRDLLRRVRGAGDAETSGGKIIGDPAMFALVRGGLLYALDAIDEAHAIFQEAHSDLGSYWHGMIHRREGDFDNARYWFRRAGTLPVFDEMKRAAGEHSADQAKQANWDPYLFTGMCEQARFGEEESAGELRELQRVEFDVLFDYCWRQSRLGESPAN